MVTSSPPKLRITVVAWLLLLAWPPVSTTAQSGEEEQTLRQMYSYGLLDSAVAYARRRQVLAVEAPEAYARWTMRLMESQAQAELRSESSSRLQDSQDSGWNRCEQTWQDFVDRYPEHRRLPWVTWQLARCHLVEAQANLARHLAVPSDDDARQRALVAIRETLQLIEELVDDIRQRQPLAARQINSEGQQAPAQQLAKLLVDCGLLSCEALLIRSRLYPRESTDRIAAATDVQSRARSILARTAADWETRKPLEIAEAAANLELGKSAEALQVLTDIAREASPSITAARAASIAIEYLAENSQVSRAQGLLPLLERSAGPPVIALAKLRIALAELNKTPDAGDREAKLEDLLSQARKIGEQFGPYYRNRAEALLIDKADSASAGSAALDLLTVEVRQMLASGNEQAAINRLLEFSKNQAAAGNGTEAIEIALKASALLAREEQWIAAADCLQPIAIQYPSLASAPGSYARSIFLLAQALRSNPQDEALADRYEASMLEQIKTWPDAEETAGVQNWLEQWLTGKSRVAEYSSALLSRASKCQQLTTARAVLIEWLSLVLDNRQSDAPREFIEQLENFASHAPDLVTTTGLLDVIALTASLNTRWPEPDEAKRIEAEIASLENLIEDSHDIQLLIAAKLLRLAQQEKIGEARRVATKWQPEKLAESLQMKLVPASVEAMDELTQTSPTSWMQILKITPSLAAALVAGERQDLQAAGLRLQDWFDTPNALSNLQRLADDNPRNGRLQLQYAKALQAQRSTKPQQLAEAARRLKRLIAGSPAGSDLNIAARWEWIKNLVARGEREQASRAAKLVLASQPMESDLWRQRFERQR